MGERSSLAPVHTQSEASNPVAMWFWQKRMRWARDWVNATNPFGNSSVATITVSRQILTGVNVTIAAPAAPTPLTPTLDGVFFRGDGSARFVGYKPPKDANGQEIATSYRAQLGARIRTLRSNGSSATFAANGDNTDVYILSGLNNGAVLYFKMTALVGTTPSAASALIGPVTIGATTGAPTPCPAQSHSLAQPRGR